MQTLARSGSTRTGPFHDLHQCPAHEESLLHYEAKVGTKHTALQQAKKSLGVRRQGFWHH